VPFPPQTNVVDANNPSRIGLTTGRVHQLGGTTVVEVAWGPHEREFVPEPLLKLFAGDHSTIESKISGGEMGSAEDLRRLLIFTHPFAELMLGDAGSVRPALLADTDDGIILSLPEKALRSRRSINPF